MSIEDIAKQIKICVAQTRFMRCLWSGHDKKHSDHNLKELSHPKAISYVLPLMAKGISKYGHLSLSVKRKRRLLQ